MKLKKSLTSFFVLFVLTLCLSTVTKSQVYASEKSLMEDNNNNVVTVKSKGCFKADIKKARKYRYYSYNESVVKVTDEGAYVARNVGTAKIYVRGFNAKGSVVGNRSYNVNVVPVTSKASLSVSEKTLYTTDLTSAYDSNSQKRVTFTIKNMPYKINTDNSFDASNVSFKTSNSRIKITSQSIVNNKVTLTFEGLGTAKVYINIFGKKLAYKMNIYYATVKSTSELLARGSKTKLKVYIGKNNKKNLTVASPNLIKWGTTRASVAKVSKNGTVSAIKNGNAILVAYIGNLKFGNIISITSKNKISAVKKAIKIYKSSSYSQARRMEKGYYDCSSLVWRAYVPYGYNFGVTGNWAPTAAGLAQYLANKGKMVSGQVYGNNISNYKLQAGDLAFGTGGGNGRYLGIYHVEMLAGYNFNGFGNNGKSYNVSVKWATNSGIWGNSVVGRP
ncbi:hypothetical protein SAMN05216249_1183 [Acetitomaculum ruminis DSM 5522]|uniref:Ig-like domain (Group 2) n=1 Tax=Acetitomaculum ruminis DSM 5522 TaxID=1120918 RepID=A0A1I0ZW27_9FIRM|nr:hypothetical protein [Acetitomaculum ruminis]SFB29542.1 hypothetical protein SAMN05216249_1183 [Acetitomaculum ruminis DSM 5522]